MLRLASSQTCSLTAMSTMEAELVAPAFAMKEAVFCSNMLTELGFGKEFAQVPLYCDNTATLHALGNSSFSSRTKHIALCFFYIRELVSEGRDKLHPDRQQPSRHRHETPEQASLQASAGPHQKFRRQYQEIVFFVCVFVYESAACVNQFTISVVDVRSRTISS